MKQNYLKIKTGKIIYKILHQTYIRLIKIRGNPQKIALGFALGIFIGMTPFMGIQTVIAVPIAMLFGWNKISAVAGVWISNPLTAPLIYSFNYMVGKNLLHLGKIQPISNNMENLSLLTLLQKTPDILWALIIGGLIVGIPLAVTAYYLSYSAVCRYQKDIKKQLQRTKEKLQHTRSKIRTKKQQKKDTKIDLEY